MNPSPFPLPRRFRTAAAGLGLLAVAAAQAATPAPAPAAAPAPAPTPAKVAAPAAAAPAKESIFDGAPAKAPATAPASPLAGLNGVATFKPVAIWAGVLGDGLVTVNPLEIRNLSALVKADQLDPFAEDTLPPLKQAPPPGKEYVILSVGLLTGRSIGRPDYVLVAGGQEYPCKAMACDVSPYDPRLMVIRQQDVQKAARLLFEIPAGVITATLRPALQTTLPQPEVSLAFRVEQPEAAAK
ncbi:MAG: hypothetical protein WC708_21705 [Lentisphaeria bacterium]